MASTKSTAVKVFGILSIVFGAISLVTAPLSFVGLETTLQLLGATGLYASWLQFTVFLSPVLAILSIVFGIGLLRYAEWGRKGSIYLAIFSIVFNILNGVISAVSLSGQFASTIPSGEVGAAIGAVVGAIIGSVVGMIYPILVLIFLTRPAAKASCR